MNNIRKSYKYKIHLCSKTNLNELLTFFKNNNIESCSLGLADTRIIYDFDIANLFHKKPIINAHICDHEDALKVLNSHLKQRNKSISHIHDKHGFTSTLISSTTNILPNLPNPDTVFLDSKKDLVLFKLKYSTYIKKISTDLVTF